MQTDQQAHGYMVSFGSDKQLPLPTLSSGSALLKLMSWQGTIKLLECSLRALVSAEECTRE